MQSVERSDVAVRLKGSVERCVCEVRARGTIAQRARGRLEREEDKVGDVLADHLPVRALIPPLG